MKRLAILVSTVLAALLAPAAAAQVSYTEPPDLSSDANSPSPVGTVTAGLNTVSGSIAASWNRSGNSVGDDGDAFSFVVPPGLAVTDIQVIVTNYTCANSCFNRIFSFSGGNFSRAFFSGGTYSPPLSGPLSSGTFKFKIDILQSEDDLAGSGSYTYEFRITAVPATPDSCQFAVPVGLGATPFDTTGATTDGPAHPDACNFFGNPQIDADIWAVYTPTQSGLLTVSLCGSSYDTELAVYSGSCDTLASSLLACNDDSLVCATTSSQVEVTVAANQPYLIRIGGYLGATGAGTLTLSQVSTGACCFRATGGCLVLSEADCQTAAGSFQGFGLPCSPGACQPCPPDFNRDGSLNDDDLGEFITAYFSSEC